MRPPLWRAPLGALVQQLRSPSQLIMRVPPIMSGRRTMGQVAYLKSTLGRLWGRYAHCASRPSRPLDSSRDHLFHLACWRWFAERRRASQPAGTDASRLEWPVFHRSIWTCRAVAGVSSPKRALVSGGRAPAYKAAGSHAKTNRPASKLAPAWAEIRFMFSHCRDKLKRGAPLCWVG